MSRAKLNGIEIDYEVSGSGQLVLLSHGYSATRRMWDGQHSREMRKAPGEHRAAQGHGRAARGMRPREGSRLSDGLPSIRLPPLIVVGDKDQPFLVPCEDMAKNIPGARLEVIGGAGHS